MFLVAAKFEFFQIRQNKSKVAFYLTSMGKYYNTFIPISLRIQTSSWIV